ncbi:MAG: hypothetical protein ABIO94_12130 [Opitutaceae bacterium]
MRAWPQAALLLTVLGLAVGQCHADPNVVVSAFANPEYTKRKYGGEKPLRETYVVMQGKYFEAPIVDRSIDRMPFQQILGFFAPELARREYWPAKTASEADLLIVVHWGTTSREVSSAEMLGRDSPVSDTSNHPDVLIQDLAVRQMPAEMGFIFSVADPAGAQRRQDHLEVVTDQVSADLAHASSAQLLGYTRDLRRLSSSLAVTTEEISLRAHLTSERYFVILKAYDLRQKPEPGMARRAVWTLHLNMRSPGTNFRIALDRMSVASADYVGRGTEEVTTVSPPHRDARVEVGTPVVIGENKN